MTDRDTVLDAVASRLVDTDPGRPLRVGIDGVCRGVARDAAALGGHDRAVEAYESRYLAACRIYLAEQHPEQRASIVIAHDDPPLPVCCATDGHPAAGSLGHEEYS